jgi:hypothetical protein
MKTTMRIGVLALALLSFTSLIHAQTPATQNISSADQKQIDEIFSSIEHALTVGGTDGNDEIKNLFASDVRESLDSDIFYGMPFEGTLQAASITNRVINTSKSGNGVVVYDATLSTTVSPDSSHESVNSTRFFSVKKEDGTWYLYDTDFYKGLDSSFANEFSDAGASSTSGMSPDESMSPTVRPGGFASIAALIGLGGLFIVIPLLALLIGLLLSVFWIWMVIAACIRPEYPHKVLWIVLIIILGPIAAIFYYFMSHRPYKASVKGMVMSAPQVVNPSAPAVPAPMPVAPSVPPVPPVDQDTTSHL